MMRKEKNVWGRGGGRMFLFLRVKNPDHLFPMRFPVLFFHYVGKPLNNSPECELRRANPRHIFAGECEPNVVLVIEVPLLDVVTSQPDVGLCANPFADLLHHFLPVNVTVFV